MGLHFILEVQDIWGRTALSDAYLIKALKISKLFAKTGKQIKVSYKEIAFTCLFGVKLRSRLHAPTEYALKDISLTLSRGETLGVIGRNGAGKTTLLKTVSGKYAPDSGILDIKGKIISLIELGAGLDPNLSGRENIFRKGLLNGVPLSVLREKIEEIIEFAELEHCIDSYVRTYSSGMKMRLAFAINIQSSGDILVIDEVLSVGDREFRQKCFKWLMENRHKFGVIFASHSMSDIASFCSKAIVLETGEIKRAGNVGECINYYCIIIQNNYHFSS